MSKKILRLSFNKDLTLSLPKEAIDMLGGDVEFYIAIDSDKNTVLLSRIDPIILANNEILDEIAELNEDLTFEEYIAPVPESFLHRRGKAKVEGEGDK